jgi:4-amino-4-deoxy-L-arabinose transferase-like glycosyltransferase
MSACGEPITSAFEARIVAGFFIRNVLMRWSASILILLVLADVWYRAHTFGPAVRDAVGVNLWPATRGETEPLDCDEAAYAYIGHRLLKGDVLYRDLTEYKPPLGYWLYALAVAAGGYDELAIRIMPIPFVVMTIVIVWWIGLRLGGPAPACVAALLYMLLSTDPYLFGNGANLEHFMNFFSVLALGLVILGRNRGGRWWLVFAGVCLGAAILVKQVAIIQALVFVPFLLLPRWGRHDSWRRSLATGVGDTFAFLVGVLAAVASAAAVLIASGAGRFAFLDIVLYGRALATDTLADPFAPDALVRWLTGNADPQGRLPWPFGKTDYLVWWGSGSWPLWLASVPALGWVLAGQRAIAERRLLAAWTVATWVEVILPGLYWQHYYLLPIPGVAIVVAVALTDGFAYLVRGRPIAADQAQRRRGWPVPIAAATVVLFSAAICATAYLQVRDYLLVAPEELTIRYKGGRQWVVLRMLGRDLARRAHIWDNPRLYIWGWQSPLNFYAKLDSPTRHFFVDNLLRDQADRNHPLIQPRIEEIATALRSHPPELIFTGYPRFRALQSFLDKNYLPSRLARGLWVKRDDYGRFETEGTRPAGL